MNNIIFGGVTIDNNIDVEKLYSDFLDSELADELFESFSIAVRKSFLAGFKLAGGETFIADNHINILNRNTDKNKNSNPR